VEVDFFDFAVGAHHAGLAPEGNREHSIGHQVSALNVGFMEHLPSTIIEIRWGFSHSLGRKRPVVNDCFRPKVAAHRGQLPARNCHLVPKNPNVIQPAVTISKRNLSAIFPVLKSGDESSIRSDLL
ncbi:hypothetical protein CXB65_18875, partial [Pseudomonas monteilii]